MGRKWKTCVYFFTWEREGWIYIHSTSPLRDFPLLRIRLRFLTNSQLLAKINHSSIPTMSGLRLGTYLPRASVSGPKNVPASKLSETDRGIGALRVKSYRTSYHHFPSFPANKSCTYKTSAEETRTSLKIYSDLTHLSLASLHSVQSLFSGASE